jgi:hypothetical protein
MRAHTRKRHTKKMDMARFLGPHEKIMEVRRFATSLGLTDIEETVDYQDVFTEFAGRSNKLRYVYTARAKGLPKRNFPSLPESPVIISPTRKMVAGQSERIIPKNSQKP